MYSCFDLKLNNELTNGFCLMIYRIKKSNIIWKSILDQLPKALGYMDMISFDLECHTPLNTSANRIQVVMSSCHCRLITFGIVIPKIVSLKSAKAVHFIVSWRKFRYRRSYFFPTTTTFSYSSSNSFEYKWRSWHWIWWLLVSSNDNGCFIEWGRSELFIL